LARIDERLTLAPLPFYLVAILAAPAAAGWNNRCQAELSPTEEIRLCVVHSQLTCGLSMVGNPRAFIANRTGHIFCAGRNKPMSAYVTALSKA
jgi:hypothetical protein